VEEATAVRRDWLCTRMRQCPEPCSVVVIPAGEENRPPQPPTNAIERPRVSLLRLEQAVPVEFPRVQSREALRGGIGMGGFGPDPQVTHLENEVERILRLGLPAQKDGQRMEDPTVDIA